MSAGRVFFDAIDRAKRAMVAKPPEDDEMECRECSGTGLADGPDGPPCEYCDGSGVW